MADDFDIADNPEWDDTNSRPLDTSGKLRVSRVQLMMSQADFAGLLGVPVSTLQNWEQRRTEPEAMARRLIDLIFDDPQGMRDRLLRLKAA
jgi:putative transcriptional regulator